ncbi:MAG: glycosyltransferase family 2 protein [bacterium]|nr:glycosyltransferase family 2 protein [bacterium]
MKIDVYSNMHNEEVILPFWLRHYETIADRIFIWEDESTDATKKILSKHPKVTFLPMEKHGDDDVYWTTTLFPQYEKYSRCVADWVIIADADEFIYHPHLLNVLEEEKRKGTQVIQCSGFTMISEGLPTTTGQIYDEIKIGLPDKTESKWTIHSANIRVRYPKGRHGPIHEHNAFVRNRETGIKLLHYRYLGEKYFEERDKKILERNRMVYHFKKEYSRQESRTRPDGTRGPVLDWYAERKGRATNVVDNL